MNARNARKAIVAALVLTTGVAMAEFKAGFARVDVTPPLGIPMVGYFSHRVADGVLDPLYVDCVAVSDGTNSALIYCVDDLHLTNPFFKKAFPAITAATGVPRDRIYVHSTHTHTGPADWERSSFSEAENKLVMLYADIRIAKMADAGRFALTDLAPATIGVTLQVVRFRRTGAPDIAIVNFGTHPDTTSGTKISADWPGVVRTTFENGIGGGVKCMFLNAAQGDVNHHWRFPPPGRKALNAERAKKSTAIAEHMGRAVAGVAMSVWDICEEVPSGPVRGRVAGHPMPTNLPTADEIKWVEMFDAGRKDEIPLTGMELKTLTSPSSRVRKLKGAPANMDILVSSLAIGDSLAFAGLPCEPFVDIGRAIKDRSPFKATLVTCLTNGSEGYIPSTKAHSEGGYEGLSSRYAASTGDLLVDAQVGQLKALKGE